jgi:hypothetical protein
MAALGPISYLSLRFDGEHAPRGTFRTLQLGERLALLSGPVGGVMAGIPFEARERWLRGGAHALALVLYPAMPAVSEATADMEPARRHIQNTERHA